jgi:hypothetical protein
MIGVPVPQLDAEVHVGDVVKVGISQLAKQGVYTIVERRRCAPKLAAFGAELFEQPECVELAVVFPGLLTHRERKVNIPRSRVKQPVLGGGANAAPRGVER